jgi:arsenical pump membrane protein
LIPGLVAAYAGKSAQVSDAVKRAVPIDLGPNLSVTGSLATILWLAALRREGLRVDAWTFLSPPAAT